MTHKKCEHNKRQSRCVECGGYEICEHKKIKYNCRECKGSAFCEHDKIKAKCRECKGSQICKHNRIKYDCRDCGGSNICSHNKERKKCKDCKGRDICQHNRIKSICKDCKGSSICEHNTIRRTCRECKGSARCHHNRIKIHCRDCGGSQICEHNKQKSFCKKCGGSGLCKSEWCETTANKKYEGYCFNCFFHLFPDRPNSLNYKTKEKATTDYILEQFPEDRYTWITDKRVADGCSRRRPDMLLDLGYQIIIIEVDENQHQDYDCSCENKRLMELSQDVGHRPIVFIRFNPDEYLTKEKKVTSCWGINGIGVCAIKKTKRKEWSERLDVLKTQIEYWIQSDNKTDKTLEVIQLFYDSN